MANPNGGMAGANQPQGGQDAQADALAEMFKNMGMQMDPQNHGQK